MVRKKFNLVAYIYKIENQINNKCYIGFTSREPKERKWEHFKDYRIKDKKHIALYSAINKYGKDKFNFEVIYASKDEDYCLEEMEQYFIDLYDSYKNGYNCALGGYKPKFTEETKLKLSESVKQSYINNPELREKRKRVFDKYRHIGTAKLKELNAQGLTHTPEIIEKRVKSLKENMKNNPEVWEAANAKKRFKWKLYFDCGKEVITDNLKKFCEENNIKYTTIKKAKRGLKYGVLKAEII